MGRRYQSSYLLCFVVDKNTNDSRDLVESQGTKLAIEINLICTQSVALNSSVNMNKLVLTFTATYSVISKQFVCSELQIPQPLRCGVNLLGQAKAVFSRISSDLQRSSIKKCNYPPKIEIN